MGSINSLPVISQVKSAAQAIVGDLEGARKTQEDFVFQNDLPVISQLSSAVYAIAGDLDKARELQENFLDKTSAIPIVSQIVSAGYAIGGDLDKAREHQERFLEYAEKFADQLPAVGHIKGGIHYAMGENEKGDESMKMASRTAGVIAGGALGLATAGPAGAAVGGAVGGALMDSLITGSDVLIHGEDGKLHGYYQHAAKIVDAVNEEDEYTFEDGLEFATLPVKDGLIGLRSGYMTDSMKTRAPSSSCSSSTTDITTID